MKKIAFYGGSFDPPHNGHLTIAKKLTELFSLDEFWFVPAFHAPHKKSKRITSPFCRYAMLALATNNEPKIKISTAELNAPEKPFTFETQLKLKNELPDAQIFFAMGADSWNEVDSWREWQKVLTLTNIIVVTRPDYEISFLHVSEEIRRRIVDLREKVSSFKSQVSSEIVNPENLSVKILKENKNEEKLETHDLRLETRIYITDAVNLDISASEIRRKIQADENDWRKLLSPQVAKYIEKYELYM